MLKAALARENVLGAQCTALLYYQTMIVTTRDHEIITTIGRFRQLTSSHVNALVFSNNLSRTPCDRALSRLVQSKYLARIERRMVGGTGAGSGQYVYQLGPRGWELCQREGRYWPYRSVSYHTLAIADAYVAMKRRERRGDIEIVGLSTEPDTWQIIAGADLRPDMHLEVAMPSRGRLYSLWIELDTGTERQKQIKEKLARYYHAYLNLDSFIPLVLFLVPDDARLKELRWIIQQGEPDAAELFIVAKLEDFPDFIFI